MRREHDSRIQTFARSIDQVPTDAVFLLSAIVHRETRRRVKAWEEDPDSLRAVTDELADSTLETLLAHWEAQLEELGPWERPEALEELRDIVLVALATREAS